jgi:SAM-dependent methyltransferase
MESTNVLEDYARDAPTLIDSFEAISSADVYAHVAHLLPAQPARVVDVGAGTGRDAAWFAAQGHSVLAVEPTDALLAAGMKLHPSTRIAWLSDTLPGLDRTLARGETFDRVVLCAVWHHLREDERARAMANLARLLAPDGILIMILRHEAEALARGADSQRKDAEGLARNAALSLAFAREGAPIHPSNHASGVTLTWLAFSQTNAAPSG